MQNFTAAPQQPGYPRQGYPQQEHPQPGYPRQVYSAQPQMTPPTRVEAPREGCPSNEKTKPQGCAIGAAGLIFMSGSLNIACAIDFKDSIAPLVVWFIGAIIGAVITCGLANRVPKKRVLLFSSLLVTIGGLVLACTHQNESGTIAACCLDGIANGLVFAPFMALAAELSVAYKRGIYASVDQLSFGIGILLQIVNLELYDNEIYNEYNKYFTIENMLGVQSAILGFLALILGSFMTIESPQHMLANNDETGATHGRRRIGQAVSTFLRIGYLRALNVMSLYSFIFFIQNIVMVHSYGRSGWYIGFVICCLLGTVFTSFCSDSLGRKKPTLLGLLVSAGMAFAIGMFWEYVRCVNFMFLVLAFFAGVAFTPSFKQHFISCTFIAEMFYFFINPIWFAILPKPFYFLYVIAGNYLCGFIIACFSFPETRLQNLRGAQGQFR